MLKAARLRCQPAIGGGTKGPLPDALVNLSIHELRKLAGFKKLEKGILKSDYIRIIREGK
jgi:hypothetical protein